MARPKSQEKRDAILAAAIELIAEQGLSVPTSKIAQAAGVAEGTLFTYFETKGRLLNELYLTLKRGEREELMRDYPFQASLEERAHHFWNTYVAFGVNHPDKYKVAVLLRFSDHINEQVKRLGEEGYEALAAMVLECLSSGALKDQPTEFGAAILISLMNMTVELILQHPAEAERFRDAGFTAFWHAVTTT
ncbi:TetR family transcriptional regulator [Reticulibacter mediterranei]|uniref:TetR family transcriptional regulator n=1 Tax=Reticulibacter mediterranei TaxID=2778369 RepID=A0A8J3N4Z8_9CHLR|nr:TetR/AcrR family transcriptional regulator [Reticulibacter mediterranei]GHO95860.1 TetR family transcriptional regulator [Reticulibacter mediterranei]